MLMFLCSYGNCPLEKAWSEFLHNSVAFTARSGNPSVLLEALGFLQRALDLGPQAAPAVATLHLHQREMPAQASFNQSCNKFPSFLHFSLA